MGTLEGIYLTPTGAAPMWSVAEAELEAGRGIAGDRYAAGVGPFSKRPGRGRHLTLIAIEALDGLRREHGIDLDPAEARRNLLTHGVDLDSLLGRRFRIGDAECVGVRDCPPCGHLQRVTQPGVVAGLQDRGGLRADVLTSGTIRVGDRIELVPEAVGAP